MRLLKRAISAIDHRLVLLAPPNVEVPGCFSRVSFDLEGHGRLLRAAQRLRGGVYLNDGAIRTEQLTSDGRHATPEDDRSWHLLMADSRGRLTACAWYLDHDHNVHFDRLRIRHSPIARQRGIGDLLWKAVDRDIAEARANGLRYAELGGWAVSSCTRGGCNALLIGLAAYSLGRIRGGALGITTATVRHGSSRILRRLGGSALAFEGDVVPPYFDERYQCDMNILRFDSRSLPRRVEPLVDLVYSRLTRVPVIARPYWPPRRERAASFNPFDVLKSMPTLSQYGGLVTAAS